MRFYLLTIFALVALVSYVHCGCDNSSEDSEESGFTHFFKNVGCDIKKGADKVSETAKKFGGTVADTFTDVKNKIAGTADNSTSTTTQATSSSSSLPEAQTPSSIDDRVLLDVEQKCPDGKQPDGRGHCRSIA